MLQSHVQSVHNIRSCLTLILITRLGHSFRQIFENVKMCIRKEPYHFQTNVRSNLKRHIFLLKNEQTSLLNDFC